MMRLGLQVMLRRAGSLTYLRTLLQLNAGYGDAGALHHLHTTSCDHLGGLFAPARPFTHLAGGATGIHNLE